MILSAYFTICPEPLSIAILIIKKKDSKKKKKKGKKEEKRTKTSPGAGTLSKQGFLPCLSIMKNSQRRTQIHSKSLKKPLLRQKDDYTPQVR